MNWSFGTWAIIWLVGFILALILLIVFCGDFKDEDGATVIDVETVVTLLSWCAIGNWAIVIGFACVGGMWILVKIGEFLSKFGGIVIYRSKPPKEKEKKKMENIMK